MVLKKVDRVLHNLFRIELLVTGSFKGHQISIRILFAMFEATCSLIYCFYLI